MRPELSTATHEAALRERVARLTNVRTGSFARVRAVQRLNDSASTLALVSAATPGMRLSEVLTTSERLGVALDGSAGWAIVVQLTSAVALMQENAPDVAHGAIAPERVVVTPDARVVVVEHVLGGMIESDGWTPERFWKEQRIATPANVESFDLRSDVTQIGVVALSLVLGRGLRDDEYPGHLAHLVESATIMSVTGDREPMSYGLRSWLDRALQLDERRSFSSAIEASAELHRLLEESESVVVPLSLEAFLSRLQTAVERDRLGAAAEAAATMTSIGQPVAEPPPMDATPAIEATTVVDVPTMERAAVETTEAAPVAEPVVASTSSHRQSGVLLHGRGGGTAARHDAGSVHELQSASGGGQDDCAGIGLEGTAVEPAGGRGGRADGRGRRRMARLSQHVRSPRRTKPASRGLDGRKQRSAGANARA